MEDIIGKKFGKLTVIKHLKPKGSLLCVCDCGKETKSSVSKLLTKRQTTCGDLSHKIKRNTCSFLGCSEESHSKNLCHKHYEMQEYRKKQRKDRSQAKDKEPKRKKEKAENQLHYARTPKGLFANFKRQVLKKGKSFDISLEEFVEIRQRPCESCGVVNNNFTGVGVVCDSKVVNKDTVKSSCVKCRYQLS